MDELRIITDFMAEYGIGGVGMIALVIIAYTRLIEERNKKKELENENKVNELESKAEDTKGKIQLEQLQLIGQMLTNGQKTAEALDLIHTSGIEESARNTEAHQRLMEFAKTSDTKLTLIEAMVGTAQTETKNTNKTLGGIMDKLNAPEPTPTISDKLDLLIREISEIKTALATMGDDFKSRQDEIETDLDTAQSAIKGLSEQIKKETQERITVAPKIENESVKDGTK